MDDVLCWKVKNADGSDLFDDIGNFVYVDNGMLLMSAFSDVLEISSGYCVA